MEQRAGGLVHDPRTHRSVEREERVRSKRNGDEGIAHPIVLRPGKVGGMQHWGEQGSISLTHHHISQEQQ